MSALPNQAADFASALAASIRRTFPAHLPLYVCAVVFFGATLAVTTAYRTPVNFGASLYFLSRVPLFCAAALMIAAIVQYFKLAFAGSRSPLKDFGAWLDRSIHHDDRPGKIVHTVLTITPLMISVSTIKSIIPVISPFSWDPVFDRWDRILFFGYRPWELLQPVLGYPFVTSAISLIYTLWFFVMFGTLFWQAFFAGGIRRHQFLLAFSLSWFVAGNVLALMFSSVGPCYYGFLFSPDPYAAQLAYLREAQQHWPVSALDVQARLWQSYVATGGANIGISAMPSLHVTIAVLCTIVAWRSARWLRVAYATFAVLIAIGSVHLGWHYAVDSIAGIGLAFLFWFLSGAILRAAERVRERALETVPAPART